MNRHLFFTFVPPTDAAVVLPHWSTNRTLSSSQTVSGAHFARGRSFTPTGIVRSTAHRRARQVVRTGRRPQPRRHVTNHLRDDAVTRTVWERDRRIVYPGRAPRTDATSEPAPAAAAPESPTDDKAA
jgi:hypothetical protein